MPAALDSFQEMFETNQLVGLAKRFDTPISGRPFSEVFAQADKIAPDGVSATWDEVDYSRGLAPLESMNSPTKAIQKTTLRVRAAPMVDIKAHVDLDRRFLYFMRNPGSVGDNARAQVDRELQNLVNKIANTKEYLMTKTCEGSVAYASVPNSNLTGTIAWPVQAISAAASWATAGTKIASTEINALHDTFMKDGGLRAARAIAHYNIDKYIKQNTEVSSLITSGPVLAARALENSFLSRGVTKPVFGDIEWTFSNAHYALDTSATTETDYLTTDRAIVFPEGPVSDYLCLAEGRYHLPATVYGAAEAATGMVTETRGMWAYAELVANPLTVRLHAGWFGLPIIKRTNAVANLDTTP